MRKGTGGFSHEQAQMLQLLCKHAINAAAMMPNQTVKLANANYIITVALQVFLVTKHLMRQSLGSWKTSVICLQQHTTDF